MPCKTHQWQVGQPASWTNMTHYIDLYVTPMDQKLIYLSPHPFFFFNPGKINKNANLKTSFIQKAHHQLSSTTENRRLRRLMSHFYPSSIHCLQQTSSIIIKQEAGISFPEFECTALKVFSSLVACPSNKVSLRRDLLRQFGILSHWDRSCRSGLLIHPVIVHWHLADQS